MVGDLIERHALDDRPVAVHDEVCRYTGAVTVPVINNGRCFAISFRIVKDDVFLVLCAFVSVDKTVPVVFGQRECGAAFLEVFCSRLRLLRFRDRRLFLLGSFFRCLFACQRALFSDDGHRSFGHTARRAARRTPAASKSKDRQEQNCQRPPAADTPARFPARGHVLPFSHLALILE